MKLLPLTLGADPEAFIAIAPRDSFISAAGIIPGTKAEPFPVKDGAVQVDGMAAEFNINPAATAKEFVYNLQSVISQLSAMLPEGGKLVFNPVASFSKKIWDEVPEVAKELGCDPDFNAYTGEVNPRPDGKRLYRTAAGHVHLGWTSDMDITDVGHVTACRMLARQLDFYLGVPSLLLDTDDKRRSMYGKAGAFRIKPYGVEYRVMNNTWLKDPELMDWVFRAAKKAFDDLMSGTNLYTKHGETARLMIDVMMYNRPLTVEVREDIVDVINGGMQIELPPQKFWAA